MPDVIVPAADVRLESGGSDEAKVTVAITLFNLGDFIAEALESVRVQTLAALDLVIVDDASDDGGGEAARRWLERHGSRFGRCALLLHESNRGLADARNQGFEWSRTPFVFILDADNEIYPRCLEVCLEAAERRQADGVYTILEMFGEASGVAGTDGWDPARLRAGNYIDAMALVRREAWRAVGGFRRMPISGWEDYDFWLKFAETGRRLACVPEILCRYRVRSASMLRTVTNAARSVEMLCDDIRLHHPAFDAALSTDSLQVRSMGATSTGAFAWISADLRRLDGRSISGGTEEVRAFLVVRDERLRLPDALAHHRALGVHRFLVVDNGSSDGTVEYLLAQPDVHVFATTAPYQQARLGMDWMEALLNQYGVNRWCLLIDADERLVYPHCESLPLSQFCRALEGRGLDSLATMVVDMYADAPIAETHVDASRPLLDVCPFFDSKGYHSFPDRSPIPRVFGGVRARLFWPEIDFDAYARERESYLTAFNEKTYLQLHEDVRSAVAAGHFESGFQHFVSFGRGEGRTFRHRTTPGWPEQDYLRNNPDVRQAVADGRFESGLEHYVGHGYFEGRHTWGISPPCLSQVSLLRWQPGIRFELGRHHPVGTRWRRNDMVGGILLHFRLLADCLPRAEAATTVDRDRAEPIWVGENQRYLAALGTNPSLSGMSAVSERYRNTEQLVELGLLGTLADL